MFEHEPPKGPRRIAGILIGLVVILACIFVGMAVMGTNAAEPAGDANARAAAPVEVVILGEGAEARPLRV